LKEGLNGVAGIEAMKYALSFPLASPLSALEFLKIVWVYELFTFQIEYASEYVEKGITFVDPERKN